MNIKAVIFDLDGVLIDSVKYHIEAWKKVMSEFCLDVPDDEIRMLESASHDNRLDYFAEKYSVVFSEEDRAKISDRKYQIYNEIADVKVYPGAIEILELINNKDIKLGLVTSSRDLDNNKYDGIGDYFEVVVTGLDVSKKKPDPEAYLIGINRLGLNPKEIIAVEDSVFGIKSAKAAGLRVIALETTLDMSYLSEADVVLKDHKELLNYFDKLI